MPEASVPPTTAADVFMKSRRDGVRGCSAMAMIPPEVSNKWSDTLLSAGRIVHLGHHAEADEGGVGVPPETLGVLRIPAAPCLHRRPSRRAPQPRRVVVPGSAADGVRIKRRAGIVEGVGLWRDRVIGRVVFVAGPLGGVAMHVEAAPGIRGLETADVRLLAGVRSEPGIYLGLRRIIAERVGGRRARARRVFPF